MNKFADKNDQMKVETNIHINDREINERRCQIEVNDWSISCKVGDKGQLWAF